MKKSLITFLVAGCASHTPPAPANGRMPDTDDDVGSIAANVWYVPGRALVCGLGAISAGLVMTLTLGQSYEDDLGFLKSHTQVVELSDASGRARAVVVPAWQGRVMTTTAAVEALPAQGRARDRIP